MLNQRLKTENSIYFSADRILFYKIDPFELIKILYKNYKIETFFIDEIHFWENYSWILKNVYDILPVKIVFSWSNMIDLVNSNYDISRRVVSYKIPIFSFREFLNLYYDLNLSKLWVFDILENSFDITRELSTKITFLMVDEYLKFGQFGYFTEWIKTYFDKLENSIKKSIYSDLANLQAIWTDKLKILEKILFFVANSVQNKITVSSISKKIGIHYSTAENYINMLVSLWWLLQINRYWNITDIVRKEKKLYFSNTNVIKIFGILENSIIKWQLRENFFVSCLNWYFWKDFQTKVFFDISKDFIVFFDDKKVCFEVWWLSKKKNKYQNDVIIVKDNILISEWKKIIPLWLFWFLY